MTITIETGSFEDLKRQLKAIGFVPANEVVETLKGGDLQIVLDRATIARSRGVESAPAPEVLTKETYSDPATDTSASDQSDTAPAEEAPKRKRRSKAEIEAEKNAAATKEDDTVDETVAPEQVNEDDLTEDDDLTGEDDAPAVDIETLRGMIKERVAGGKKPEVIALFTRFGTDKLPNLDEAKYPAFYAELSMI